MLKFLALIVLLITITVGIMAPQVIQLLFGDSYIRAVIPLKVLLLAAVFMFMNYILNTILISGNQEKTVLKITALGLAVMTISNIILVRLYGITGAAASVVISEVCINGMLIFAMRKYLFRVPVYKITWRPIIAGGAVTGILYLYLPSESVTGAAIFAVLYIVLLFILRAFTIEDIIMLKNMLLIPGKPQK